MTSVAVENLKPIFIRPNRVPVLFGISREQLYRLAARGDITIHKRGNSSFVKCDDIERYITGADPSAAMG